MATTIRLRVWVCVAAAAIDFCLAATVSAQQAPGAPAAPTAASRPFEILDNSFLVEEAFNQEAGIVQSIAGFLRAGGGWALGFTQEWPLRSQRHQLSYSVPVLQGDGVSGLGDILINYRHQTWTEGRRRPAFAPRVSVILPSGDPDRGTGEGVVGWQVNLPFSKQARDFYFHWNAGLTVLPGRAASPSGEVTLSTPAVSGSVIWRVAPMFNLMLEQAWLSLEEPDASGGTVRGSLYTLSPGVRGGWNAGDAQIILGVAAPITWEGDRAEAGIFLYLSYELPFKKQ